MTTAVFLDVPPVPCTMRVTRYVTFALWLALNGKKTKRSTAWLVQSKEPAPRTAGGTTVISQSCALVIVAVTHTHWRTTVRADGFAANAVIFGLGTAAARAGAPAATAATRHVTEITSARRISAPPQDALRQAYDLASLAATVPYR